jgi:hypothetical protein
LCFSQRRNEPGRRTQARDGEPLITPRHSEGDCTVRRLFLASCFAAVAVFLVCCAEARADHFYRGYGLGGHRNYGYVSFNWHNPGYFFPRHVYRPYPLYQPYPVYNSYPNSYPVYPSYDYAPHYDYSNNLYISGPNYNFGVIGD